MTQKELEAAVRDREMQDRQRADQLRRERDEQSRRQQQLDSLQQQMRNPRSVGAMASKITQAAVVVGGTIVLTRDGAPAIEAATSPEERLQALDVIEQARMKEGLATLTAVIANNNPVLFQQTSRNGLNAQAERQIERHGDQTNRLTELNRGERMSAPR